MAFLVPLAVTLSMFTESPVAFTIDATVERITTLKDTRAKMCQGLKTSQTLKPAFPLNVVMVGLNYSS